jgi:hypothetical protein
MAGLATGTAAVPSTIADPILPAAKGVSLVDAAAECVQAAGDLAAA